MYDTSSMTNSQGSISTVDTVPVGPNAELDICGLFTGEELRVGAGTGMDCQRRAAACW